MKSETAPETFASAERKGAVRVPIISACGDILLPKKANITETAISAAATATIILNPRLRKKNRIFRPPKLFYLKRLPRRKT